MIDLNLSKNTTVSEIKDIIEELYESDISFINIKKEKSKHYKIDLKTSSLKVIN